MSSEDTDSPLIDTVQAAKYLGLSPSTLTNARTSGILGRVPAPKFIKIGKAIRYSKKSLDHWLEQFEEMSSTSSHQKFEN